MPNSVDDYIHRIGRTGRAENVGEAITFTLPENEHLLRDIEKALGKSIERKRLDEFNYEGFDPLNKPSNFRNPAQRKHKTTPYRKQNRQSNTWHGKKRPYKTATR